MQTRSLGRTSEISQPRRQAMYACTVKLVAEFSRGCALGRIGTCFSRPTPHRLSIDQVAYETYPCDRCINIRHPLAFGHIVALQAQDEVTGRSEWTKRKGSNRTRLESYREVEPKGI